MIKSLLFSCIAIVAVAFMFVPMASTAEGQQQNAQTSQTQWEYAQLRIASTDAVTFDEGGSQLPITRSLRVIYRQLGGNDRDSLVNLLRAIGNKGWELVVVDDEQKTWTFKRRAQQ
jgi:hypothetical protein